MTKRASKDEPQKYPDDSKAMTDTIDWLIKNRIRFRRCTVHQIKVGDLNFYPNSGSIQRDQSVPGPSAKALKERGLAAFQHMVEKYCDAFNSIDDSRTHLELTLESLIDEL
jgi:hypothetical protein